MALIISPFFCIHSDQVIQKIEVKGAYFRSEWEINIQIWMKSSYKLFQMNKNKDIRLYKATLWQNLYKALTGNNSKSNTLVLSCNTVCMLHLYPEPSMTKMFSQRQIKVKLQHREYVL